MNLDAAIEEYALSLSKTILVFKNEKFRKSSQEYKAQENTLEELYKTFTEELKNLGIISTNEDGVYYTKKLTYEYQINQLEEEIGQGIDNNKPNIEVVLYHYYFQLLKSKDEVEKILSSQLYPVPIEIEKIKKLDIYFNKLRYIVTKADRKKTIYDLIKNNKYKLLIILSVVFVLLLFELT